MPCRYPGEPGTIYTENELEVISAAERARAEEATSSSERFLGLMSSGWKNTVEDYTALSPRLDLSHAVYRVWKDVNRGFFAEARLTPKSEPIYTPLTAEQAELLKSPIPPPELVATLFMPTPISGLH